MSANTLYDVLKPIIFLVNIYRVKIRPAESVRWVTKGIRLVLCLNFPVYLFLCIATMHLAGKDDLDTYRFRTKVLACTLCFVYFNWRIQIINVILTTLKTVVRSAQNEKAFRKVRRVLLFVFAFLFLDIFIQFRKFIQPSRGYLWLIVLAALTGPSFTFCTILYAMATITFFICLLVYYVSLSFEGPVEQLERCKSPLRRARMTTDLIRHFYQTNKLIEVTNTFAAPLMFILKMTAILQFFAIIYYWENQRLFTFGDSSSIYPTIIYLWYMQAAPSANSKLSQLYQTLLKTVMEDDLWLSRDPTSRPYLLRLRLSQLEQLSHLSIGQTQFTVLNEPVDEADVFLFFVEMLDTWNTIHTPNS